jgi:Ca-activated chloride channel family protein
MNRHVITHALVLIAVTVVGCSAGEQKKGETAQSSSQLPAGGAPPASRGDDAYLRPPNGAAYEDMHFKHYGTNPFVATDEDRLSTFAADVDTGSYTVMRNYVSRGSLPPEDAVRVEEFINYFPAAYPPPSQGAFAIHVDGGPSPFGPGYDLVRIGIKGKEIAATHRKPAHLVFVIDVSGSMNREDRLELVKKSLHVLVDRLGEQDQVGIVVYGSEGRKLLEPTSAENKERILAAIDQLVPEGSTNAEEGLKLGYEMAAEHFLRDGVNRVILCSDGVANVGNTSAEGILPTIERYAGEGIALSTFGFGMGNYNDVLMEQLADKGNGSYSYIDTFSEARRVFAEALTGTLQTIATDVKIQVEFDPGKVDRYRLLGYENRDVRDEDFRNDRTDGGEIGAGHTVTALYEIKRKGEARDGLGTVRVRYRDPDTGKTSETAQPIAIGEHLSTELKFLAAVAECAEILRGSYWAKDSSLAAVRELAEATAAGEEQLEFVRLLKDAAAIRDN